MPSQRKREQRRYHDAYRRGAPTKHELRKSDAYIVLSDLFGRLYYIDAQNDIHVQEGEEREVECYVALARTSEPVDGPVVDERVYTFPEEDERVTLTVHRWKGRAWRGRESAPTTSAVVHEPYQYGARATGTAVLRLTHTTQDPPGRATT